ncbi:hypothetical protein ABPG72_002381 [Tetrahymena utriculariae]
MKKKTKSLQNANLAIFLQTLIYLAYMISNYQFEKNIKQNACTSTNSSQNRQHQLSDQQYQSQILSIGFCDEYISWYLIQGQIIYFYLYAQQNYIFSLLLIFINFLAGVLCYEEQLWTHIFLIAISLCIIYQKSISLAQTKQQSALLEYIFQKYQFWHQFAFKYVQNNIFLAQLSSPTEHKSIQKQIDIQQYFGFSRYIMQNNQAQRKLSKKPSITYQSPQHSTDKFLGFPFVNLRIQQQMPNFQNECLNSFNSYLNKYALRSMNQKDSVYSQNPCKSIQESRLSFKDQQRGNGVQNLGNIGNYNNGNNDQNCNNNNILNNITRLQTNQHIQQTSHNQTNQNEETIQFDSHPIHFSSYNQIINQNKNGSHQCIYLLQNSSMQHIQYENHYKSNLKNGNYNTNHTNSSNLNGKHTTQNPILKRSNLCQNNLIQNSNNNTDRKNSLLFQGSSSPQVYNPFLNELIGVKSVEQTKNIVIQDKNNCVDSVMSKKENKSTELPLKCMDGESLLTILMKNLAEQEQNQIQDKKQTADFSNKFLQKQQDQSPKLESKLGTNQNIYIFERTDSQCEDSSGPPQYFQVKFIDCVYEGKQSYLIMMEELKKSISIPNIESKLISSSQEKRIKSDNLKIKTFKQKIISSLAHELKTPLNSIISQINQLQLNRNEDSVSLKSKDIQILKSSANLLNYKIEDLLNYSMYMKGENKLNLEKFSILEIVNEMIEIFKPQAKLKNLYFHSKITLFQPSLKKSLELKNCKNSSPQIDGVIDQIDENVVQNPLKSIDKKVLQKYEFCPVEDFKKKFVSLKFMSEKVINTPLSDIYSNTSEKSSQQQPQNEVKEQQQFQQRQSQCTSNNYEYNQHSSKNTVYSPLKQQDAFVRSDRKKLICILTNLLTNALKFTFKGGISFTVNQIDKYNFEFSVSDTGIGIEQKLVKRMNNVNIEDYDTIFMNDQEEESLNEQDISEELQEIKDHRNYNQNNNNNNKNNSFKQIIPKKQNLKKDQSQIKNEVSANKENNELEKKSRIEESAKKELKLSLFQQESQKIKLQQKHDNERSVIKVKEACSINESISNGSKDGSPYQQDNKKSSPAATKEEDKNICSIRLIENNDQMKKSNASSFSLQNQKQQKNQHYKSQPSLFNFQRNCGIGIKIVKILTSQLSSNTQNLKIKSKENLGSTIIFTLEDQQRAKATMSQFVISDRNMSKKNIHISEVASRQNLPNYILTHPYKDEIILSDSSIESHEDIKSQYAAQKSNTNRSCNSIAEFVDNQKYDQNDGCFTPRLYNHENVRKCNQKKNKSDLDFLANKNLLNQNSLKLQTLLSNKRILLVDDMPFNIQILKNYLKGVENLEIKEAFNGMSAIEQVQQEKFDLILMDINMPLMDGIEATFKITELIKSNQIQPVPIIIVSAYTAIQDIQNSLKSGAAGHVSKPISIKSLISEINKVLNTY